MTPFLTLFAFSMLLAEAAIPSAEELFGWAMSGHANLIAAAMLFWLIAVVERFPFVKPWIGVDGWKAGEDDADSWLTSKRKKMVANLVLASGPLAMLLASGADWHEVVMQTVTIALLAAGVNANLNTILPVLMNAKPKHADE
jgi:hypothetical protein